MAETVGGDGKLREGAVEAEGERWGEAVPRPKTAAKVPLNPNRGAPGQSLHWNSIFEAAMRMKIYITYCRVFTSLCARREYQRNEFQLQILSAPLS